MGIFEAHAPPQAVRTQAIQEHYVCSSSLRPTHPVSKGVFSLGVSAPALPALTSIADLARSNSISRADVFPGLVNWSTQASDVPCDEEGWSHHHRQLSTP